MREQSKTGHSAQAGIIYAMIEASAPFRARRSPLQSVFRNLWIVVAGEVLLFGVAIQSELSMLSRLENPTTTPEDAAQAVHVARTVGSWALVAVVVFFAIMIAWTVWTIARERQVELAFSDGRLLLPDGTSIPCSGIGTVLFVHDPQINDPMLFTGVTAEEGDGPDSSIEEVHLFAQKLEQGLVDKGSLPFRGDLGFILRFHHFPGNEKLAKALVHSLLHGNPDASVLTLINKHRRQRVIWRSDCAVS